jgi:hypothetical protein
MPRTHHRRLATSACLLALAVLAAGALRARAAAPSRGSLHRVTHVFGLRYCELLLVHTSPKGLIADVYNTFGLNTCPARRWHAINLAAVAKRTHALTAVPNGPRFWLMNEIDKQRSGAAVVKNLGGLPMIEEATVAVGANTRPYSVHRVDRTTVFVFNAGATIYELRARDGARWVMQSYSRQIDPTLTRSGLTRLGSRLQLPAGWTYATRRLTHRLRIVTVNTAAQVLQDNLDNTYSRVLSVP